MQEAVLFLVDRLELEHQACKAFEKSLKPDFVPVSLRTILSITFRMAVQQTIPFEEGTFFITFSCNKWINLIETTWSYDLV